MPKRIARVLLPTQSTLVLEGDLEIDVTEGILTIRDYGKRTTDGTDGILISAAKGFWISMIVTEPPDAA